MKECKFCKKDDGNAMIEKTSSFEVTITKYFGEPAINVAFDDIRGYEGSCGEISIPIVFCPMCGRRF